MMISCDLLGDMVFSSQELLATWRKTYDSVFPIYPLNIFTQRPTSWIPNLPPEIPSFFLEHWASLPYTKTNPPIVEPWQDTESAWFHWKESNRPCEYTRSFAWDWDLSNPTFSLEWYTLWGVMNFWIFLTCVYVLFAVFCFHLCPTLKWVLCLRVKGFYLCITRYCEWANVQWNTWRFWRSTATAETVELWASHFRRCRNRRRRGSPLLPTAPQLPYAPGAVNVVNVINLEQFRSLSPFRLPESTESRSLMSAVFPMKINGARFLTLLDTGASISLTGAF